MIAPHHRNSEEIMKLKILVVFSTLFLALSLMAQSTTPTTPAPAGDQTKTCACCNQADGKMTCCQGEDGNCCKGGSCCQGKDGKTCPMMSKDSSGKMSCCTGGKCSMMSEQNSKGCCCGKMCARPKTST